MIQLLIAFQTLDDTFVGCVSDDVFFHDDSFVQPRRCASVESQSHGSFSNCCCHSLQFGIHRSMFESCVSSRVNFGTPNELIAIHTVHLFA